MISVIITAAGNGVRFGWDKMWLNFDGKPVIEQTVGQFIKVKKIKEIIAAIRSDEDFTTAPSKMCWWCDFREL